MKNSSISFLILGLFSFILFSCSDDDGDDNSSDPRPKISLNGDASPKLSLNTKYVELGATATDGKGNDISSSVNINGAVDYNKTGLYELTYTATASSGKTSNPAVRKVTVKNDAEYLEGVYTATHKCSSSAVNTDDFNTTISTSSEVNNMVFFSNLNPVSGKIQGNVAGSVLAIPQGFGTNNTQYSGTGTISNQNIEIQFNTNATGYSNCTIKLPR